MLIITDEHFEWDQSRVRLLGIRLDRYCVSHGHAPSVRSDFIALGQPLAILRLPQGIFFPQTCLVVKETENTVCQGGSRGLKPHPPGGVKAGTTESTSRNIPLRMENLI